MCLKSGWAEPANRVVGDPLQRGFVLTKAFGRDQYVREEPKPSTPRDTRIPKDSLPPEAPEGNGFFGAHQEYFHKCKDRRRDKKGPPCQEAGGNSHADIRDDITGGFPGGALRLNECTNLPGEATCGLVASSGFNECLGGVRRGGDLNIAHCFDLFTAFAGMRACNAANPCRDDYICAMPIAQSRQRAEALYAERAAKLKDSKNRELYEKLATREYDSNCFYG